MPHRIEFQITDRETGNIILDKIIDTVNETIFNDDSVLYIVSEYVKVFNWNRYEHKKYNTYTYVGKGVYKDGVL
jgi:hypothetical protein